MLRKSPGYAPYVRQIEPRTAGDGTSGRTDLERALAAKPVHDLLSLLPFATAADRDFLAALLRGFEVENLKRVLRRLRGARPTPAGAGASSNSPLVLFDLGRASRVSVNRLREVQSTADLMAAVAGSPFQRPLANAMPHAEAAGTTFPLEAALDDDLLAVRFRAAGRLSGQSREHARRLLGVEADVLSLCWLYRGRFLLGMSAEELLPRLPGFGYRLPPGQVRSLAATEDAKAFASAGRRRPVRRLVQRLGRDHGRGARPQSSALAAHRGTRPAYRAALQHGPGSRLPWMVDREVRDVCAIAECVHYGAERTVRLQSVAGGAA